VKKPSTERIRIELCLGALSTREIAKRCGASAFKVWPLLWQMQNRTGEVVKLRGMPVRWKLKRQHTALEGWR
jgi:hypothetical protein